MRLAARIFVYFVAFLLSLPELIAAGKWLGRAVEQLLRWGEHAEFVVHRLEDLRSSRLGDYIPEIPQWASIICLGFAVALVLWDNRRSRRFALARGTHLPSPASHPSWWRAKRKSPFVSVEMWMQPRSYRDPSEVIAKIDGLRRQDGLTVLVRYAEAIHTESESHWKWSQTHRLVQQSNIVQGEKLRPSVLFRPNEGEDEIRAAGGQTYKVGDGLLLLVEIRAIAASETIVARAPFHFRNIGGTRLSEPSRLDELGYIKNLDG